MAFARWTLTEEERQDYMERLMKELSPLRAKAGISQADLANLIGVSRQTYSAIESRKRPMQWSTYLSLLLFFDRNRDTRDLLRQMKAYPEDLFRLFMGGKNGEEKPFGEDRDELEEIWRDLDDQAKHSLKTMLLMEYARCKKVPGETVIKAYDGVAILGASDEATESALKKIRQRHEREEG
ncbi:MAG: helix-turn-helix domain-containing protein [Blautia sp.]|nr:helix-turn-helix domain-containing protein [Blautia sp.]